MKDVLLHGELEVGEQMVIRFNGSPRLAQVVVDGKVLRNVASVDIGTGAGNDFHEVTIRLIARVSGDVVASHAGTG